MTAIAALILIGTALVFLETVLIGGIWAVAGICCHAGAAYLAYADFGAPAAAAVGAVSVAMCISAFLVWLYVLPKTPFGRKLYLDTKQDGHAPAPDFSNLAGKTATALTPLTPSGKVEVCGTVRDAQCQNGFAETGEKLEVVGATAFELKVEKFNKQNTQK